MRRKGSNSGPDACNPVSPPTMAGITKVDVSVPVESDTDIVSARHRGRQLAAEIGFSPTDATLIATAISELARNIILYAKRGQITLKFVNHGDTDGIVIVASDQGPGIPDVKQAVQDGYSTSRSLGLGLPGVRRLMDDFEIVSKINQGTTVTVKKWRR